MPVSAFERWIDKSATRIRFGEFLLKAADCGAAFLFAFGTIVLMAKLFVPGWWPHVLWLAAGAMPAAGLAWWLARRHPWSRGQMVARLDGALNSGGLLMTLCELPDDEWAGRLPQVEELWQQAMPRLRPVRFVRNLTLPLVFAVGACFVPLRTAATAPVIPNTVGQTAARELEELITSLDEEAVLEQKESEQLKEEVARLAEETKTTPLTHEKWEAVDALKERMKVRVDAAAMTTAEARDAAAALASREPGDGMELSAEQTERLEKKLSETLQKLSQKGMLDGASKDLKDRLQRLTKNGKLELPSDPAERQELLDDLQKHLDQEAKKLSALRKKCSLCRGGECDGEEGDSLCEGEQFGKKSGKRPGKGGVNRGRGDAPLTWGDESDEEGVKFKETVLPQGFLEQPKDELVGVGRAAPDEEAAPVAARSTQRVMDPAAGNTTWNRKLNPRHRNVVRKYFSNAGK